MVELFSGALILADQTMQVCPLSPLRLCAVVVRPQLIQIFKLQSDIGALWAPVAQLKPKENDLQLGLCR